jgi:peptide/nickel transport system substrate-binding protein
MFKRRIFLPFVLLSLATVALVSAACTTEKIVEVVKEVPVEVVREVVVETVKEVEVVKEVPVEKIVERVITKIVERKEEKVEKIRDPRSGEMINPPQYGGTMRYALPFNPGIFDGQFGSKATRAAHSVLEKLLVLDWAGTTFEEMPFGTSSFNPSIHTAPNLATSWEGSSDLKKWTFDLRDGVQFHKNDLLDWNGENGRLVKASDWKHAFDRQVGLGKYEENEPNPFTSDWVNTPTKSFEAPDDDTFVINLTRPWPNIMSSFSHTWHGSHVYPEEVIEQFGDFKHWEHAIGTGPFIPVAYEDDVAITYDANPNYWQTSDPLFPDYHLPYLDRQVALIMPEAATRLAALRTAKLDWERRIGYDKAMALEKSNPDLKTVKYTSARGLDMGPNHQHEPWGDILVRKAANMSIDRETIATAYYKGWADPTIMGIMNGEFDPQGTPFREWPEDLQAEYTYNPDAANKILDDAGYARGSDGFRFKTAYELSPQWKAGDVGYAKLIKYYFSQIGIDLEIKVFTKAELVDRIRAHTNDLSWTDRGKINNGAAFVTLHGAVSTSAWDAMNMQSAEYEAIIAKIHEVGSFEEQTPLVQAADMWGMKNHTAIMGFDRIQASYWWPWIGGYRGENNLRGGPGFGVFQRVWIDQDIKSDMGHK